MLDVEEVMKLESKWEPFESGSFKQVIRKVMSPYLKKNIRGSIFGLVSLFCSQGKSPLK